MQPESLQNLVLRWASQFRHTPHYQKAAIRHINVLSEAGDILDITQISESAVLLARDVVATRLSQRTANNYLKSYKTFAHWLEDQGYLPVSPLDDLHVSVPRMSRPRRVLSTSEVDKILGYLKHSREKIAHLSARDRRAMYILALNTGVRKGEITKLTPNHFYLNESPAYLALQPVFRSPSHQRVVLSQRVVDELVGMVSSRPPQSLIWPRIPSKLMVQDCEGAGVVYSTSAGLADLSAWRWTYLDRLARTGLRKCDLMVAARVGNYGSL